MRSRRNGRLLRRLIGEDIELVLGSITLGQCVRTSLKSISGYESGRQRTRRNPTAAV